jgi:N6-adenosine-specific RNA methylase IME4/DNA-binding transcriptional regulator YiaG
VLELKPWPELQEALPPLATYEFEALKASIEAHGVLQHALVLPDGRIIDGYHRWQIVGDKLPYDVLDLDEQTAFLLGLAINSARRQMSPEQIKELRKRQKVLALALRRSGMTQAKVAGIVGVAQKTIDLWETTSISSATNACSPPDLRISVPKAEYETIYSRYRAGEPQSQIASDYKISQQRVSQIIRIVEARYRQPILSESPVFPTKRYHCIVIDPPWPMRKIEREERPDQGFSLDYPTMTLDEIQGLPIPDLADPSGCHIYLWVTQKHLPDGLAFFEAWGVNYQCILTWVKPTGFTPFSWQYNTEHVLFGKVGNLDLLKTGVKLSFQAPGREHSRKPDIFYRIVCMVSPAPRLDMFSREERDGFEAYGNEVDKYTTKEKTLAS